MVKNTGHSKSKTYSNHSKTSTDIPSGYEYVAEQIKDAQRHVKRLDMHADIMAGKGPGDLSLWSKRQQGFFFDLGFNRLTSSNYKKTKSGHAGFMSDEEYDRYVRKGIAAEYTSLPLTVQSNKNKSKKQKGIS